MIVHNIKTGTNMSARNMTCLLRSCERTTLQRSWGSKQIAAPDVGGARTGRPDGKPTGAAVCRILGEKSCRGHNHRGRFRVRITGLGPPAHPPPDATLAISSKIATRRGRSPVGSQPSNAEAQQYVW